MHLLGMGMDHRARLLQLIRAAANKTIVPAVILRKSFPADCLNTLTIYRASIDSLALQHIANVPFSAFRRCNASIVPRFSHSGGFN